MAYTLGANHSLIGTGSFAVSSPIGLKYTVAAPAWIGSRFGTPPELIHVGRLALGNADGYLPQLELTHAAGLFLPLPAGMTLLGYTMTPGVTAEVRELLDVPALSVRPQPWDRTPTPVTLGTSAQLTGGTALYTQWTFTVPAGKMLMVASANLRLARYSAPSAVGIPQVQILAGGGVMLTAHSLGQPVGSVAQDSLSGGPLVLPAGTVVSCLAGNSDTGGDVRSDSRLAGYTFDV